MLFVLEYDIEQYMNMNSSRDRNFSLRQVANNLHNPLRHVGLRQRTATVEAKSEISFHLYLRTAFLNSISFESIIF